VQDMPVGFLLYASRCSISASIYSFLVDNLHQKGLPESEVSIVSPMELGGLKSDDYLAVNPQGKMPSLRCESTGLCVAESDTICRYLMSEYAHLGPSFQPDNPTSNVIARFHDIYLTTIQNCLYKPGPPFGSFGNRKDALEEYSKQLYTIADMMMDDDTSTGPYMCGNEVSLADATVFPSVVFATFMFPKMDSGIEQPIPTKIQNWFNALIESDAAFKKVYDEVSQSLARPRLLYSCEDDDDRNSSTEIMSHDIYMHR
jgi:glutathione S-transferase